MADSLTCSLEGRAFQALLSGLCRSNFFGERITHESLALQLFSGLQRQEGEGELEPAEVAAQIRIFEKLLRRAAQKNWDIAKLEGVLASSDIDPTNSRILLQFWSNEREKIHTALARASSFNNHLNDFSWRVDVQTASKKTPEINMPIAVVEFGLQSGYKDVSTQNSTSASSSTVRFGMNRDEVATLIDQLEQVQKAVDSATS